MKVLQILYSGLGGHGSVFFSMAEADVPKEFEHEALFNGIENVRDEYKTRCEKNGIKFSFLKKQPGKHLGFFFRLMNAVRRSDADIVVNHAVILIFPVWLGSLFRFKKRKIITVLHEGVQIMRRQDWLALRAALFLKSKIVFLSEEYRQVAEKLLKKDLSDQSAVIPNGIDLAVFKPADNTSKITDGVSLGMQSRIVATKDHTTLINAFEILKSKAALPVKLYIAGDGALRDAMKTKAQAAGLENDVVFEGMLSENELPHFIQKLDIYVHATLSETMSTAIMQVMACRKPVVASDVPGVHNMIRHGETGFCVPPQNSEKLAEAVLHLLSHKEEAARLAENAFVFAKENYSNKIMFERYKKVFYDA